MGYYEQNLQRKQEIEDGLLALMGQMPYEQITVKDIAEHMGFVRKTFYHYFPGKKACLESLIDRMIHDAVLYMTREAPESYHDDLRYKLNLIYWKQQKVFLDAIGRNSLVYLFKQRVLMRWQQQEDRLPCLSGMDPVWLDEDLLYFHLSGQISLLMRWSQRGFDPSVEEMAEKFRQLYRNPQFRQELP